MLGVLSLLVGCASVVRHPAPLPQTTKAMPREYRIEPGDQMDIKLFYNPELNESVTVRPDGRISLQLANEIPAAGLTPAELTQELKRSYGRELIHPEITVIMRQFAGQRVYVDGEVQKAGFVPLAPNMTVMEAVTMAGGLKNSARTNEIVVIRREPQGKPQVFTLDLGEVVDGTNIGQDLALEPLDVVFVPKSPIGNVNMWLNQYLWQNIPVTLGAGAGYYK
jgi:protein involved in polysaccharide export with SLBB domain